MESHPFVLIVEPHLIFDNRFGWRIFKNCRPHRASDEFYGSRDEAQAAGEIELRSLTEAWENEE